MFSRACLLLIVVNIATLCEGRDPTSTRKPYVRPNVEILSDYYGKLISLSSGRPRLDRGSTSCWLRGGICTQVRDCHSMNVDSTVSSCNHGLRVCCVFNRLGPNVYNTLLGRRENQKNDGDDILEALAEKNSMILGVTDK